MAGMSSKLKRASKLLALKISNLAREFGVHYR